MIAHWYTSWLYLHPFAILVPFKPTLNMFTVLVQFSSIIISFCHVSPQLCTVSCTLYNMHADHFWIACKIHTSVYVYVCRSNIKVSLSWIAFRIRSPTASAWSGRGHTYLASWSRKCTSPLHWERAQSAIELAGCTWYLSSPRTRQAKSIDAVSYKKMQELHVVN